MAYTNKSTIEITVWEKDVWSIRHVVTVKH